MKGRLMSLLSNRDHLLLVDEMYHSVVKKEEEESERLTNKLYITSNFLKSTQRSLQESKLQIYKIQKELKVSHLSCCMEGIFLGVVGISPLLRAEAPNLDRCDRKEEFNGK